jgi:hypothetical protein
LHLACSFTLPSPWKSLEVLLMIGTIGLAVHMVNFGASAVRRACRWLTLPLPTLKGPVLHRYYVDEAHVAHVAPENAFGLDHGRTTGFDLVHTDQAFRAGLSTSIILTRACMMAKYALTA